MTAWDASTLAPEHRSTLTLHGAAAVLAGMLGGMAFLFNILRFIEIFPFVPRIHKRLPGTEAAWRAAHTGPIMNGMLALAIGAAGPRIRLGPTAQRRLVTTLLVTVWGNTLGYNAAAVGGERGLQVRGGRLNKVAYFSFLSAALSVFVAMSLVLKGVANGRKQAEDDEPLTD